MQTTRPTLSSGVSAFHSLFFSLLLSLSLSLQARFPVSAGWHLRSIQCTLEMIEMLRLVRSLVGMVSCMMSVFRQRNHVASKEQASLNVPPTTYVTPVEPQPDP